MCNCRLAVRLALHLSALLPVFAWIGAPFPGPQITYNFVGVCSDCTGTATAQLVLASYNLGANIQSGNFVSLTYSSNLTNFTILASDRPDLKGALPPNLPAPANFGIRASGNRTFIANNDGTWCAGPGCNADSGTSGTWSLPPVAVPTVRAPVLIGVALTLAALGLFLLTRARWSVAA